MIAGYQLEKRLKKKRESPVVLLVWCRPKSLRKTISLCVRLAGIQILRFFFFFFFFLLCFYFKIIVCQYGSDAVSLKIYSRGSSVGLLTAALPTSANEEDVTATAWFGQKPDVVSKQHLPLDFYVR